MVLPRVTAISRRSLFPQQSSAVRLRANFFPKSTSGIRMSSKSSVPNPIPATFLRGGTSKGIFLKKSDLPADQEAWDSIFLGIMGSPDAVYGRQLNGMGGGVSSLSKIMVVGPPTSQELKDQGVQCEYTFAQVGIRDEQVDYSGNCGNLTSVVGVFAVDEGLVRNEIVRRKSERLSTVRCYNTNTKKIVDTTFPVSETGVPELDLPEGHVAGVPGHASRIILDFINPGGAATGRLLPTSNPKDTLTVTVDGQTHEVTSTLVDATNPTVFVLFDELRYKLGLPMWDYVNDKPDAVARVSPVLEDLRQAGAVKMGLNPDAQAQPKIALLNLSEGDIMAGFHMTVHALSMGVLHRAVPMTVGLCLGVAARTKGTIAWELAEQARTEMEDGPEVTMVRILHPGGAVVVGAEIDANGDVTSAKVLRTGRRLMKGVVWY